MKPRVYERLESNESYIRKIAAKAAQDAAMLGAHSLLLETAMRMLLKHNLLEEFAHEMSNPPIDERDRLEARIRELEGHINATPNMMAALQHAIIISEALPTPEGVTPEFALAIERRREAIRTAISEANTTLRDGC